MHEAQVSRIGLGVGRLPVPRVARCLLRREFVDVGKRHDRAVQLHERVDLDVAEDDLGHGDRIPC